MLIINSFPKSGTNLAKAMVEQRNPYKGHVSQFNGSTGERVGDNKIMEALLRVEGKGFITTHLHWSPELASLISRAGITMVLLLRDNRDVIVSHAHYIKKEGAHHLHPYYKYANLTNRIWMSMRGIPGRLPNIADRLLPYLGWAHYDFIKVITYEELIKHPEGWITLLNHYAGTDISSSYVEEIRAHVKKGSSTFRRGKTGEWREAFTQEQIDYYEAHFSWIDGGLK